MEGYYFSQTSGQVEKSYTGEDEDLLTPTGLCLPNYPPGFQFWSSGQTTGTSGNSGRFNVTTSFGTGYVNPSSTGTSSGSCNLGNAKVTIKWEKKEKPVDWLGLFGGDGDWECANDECKKYDKDPKQAKITDEEAKAWAGDMNEICYRLGDCGGYVNWKGKYTDDGYAAYNDGKRLAGSGGSEILEKQKTAGQTDNAGAQTPSSGIGGLTGNIVKDLIKKVVGN
jgi:hypothetical protein